MNFVEQAVFTSAETSRTAGYQLVAQSAGITEEDGRALSAWGPSHGSLLGATRQASSINFFRLPSGNYCVSRTTASGNEYSGRGTRIYSQCLVVCGETLKDFANNPFALVRAASGSGLLRQYEQVPAGLERVSLVGRAPTVDSGLLARSRRELGAEAVACLVEAALQCRSMAIVGASCGELAIAALLNCLPPQIRPEFSFSTGLRTSARRPFRLVALGDDPEERRRARQDEGLTLIDLGDVSGSQRRPAGGWPRAICRIVETGRTSLLSRWFDQRPTGISAEQLDALGAELLEELAGEGAGPPKGSFPRGCSRPVRPPCGAADDAVEASAEAGSSQDAHGRTQMAHAAHPQFLGTSAGEQREPGPSGELAAERPEVVASLETLDDLVFNAVKGDAASLAELQSAWPRVKAELGNELLAQSREQYLRYALQVWERCVEAGGSRTSGQAMNALEVLCMLFDDVN
ncbi:MAG: GAP1-N2 domain-containing protein [Thermoguttaceae bacterium]